MCVFVPFSKTERLRRLDKTELYVLETLLIHKVLEEDLNIKIL
jgi:hypothetical protein